MDENRIILAKVGTGCGCLLRVMRRRKPICVGDVISVKDVVRNREHRLVAMPGQKEYRVRVWMHDAETGRYFVEHV